MGNQTKQNQRVIVFEGLDASGKHTQSTKLSEHLWEQCISNYLISFPEYKSYTGELIQDYLNGVINIDDPYVVSLLYSMNRSEALRSVDDLQYNDFIIFDRYNTSNCIYQMPHTDDWEKYIRDQEYVEYKILKHPKPTDVIFLDVPAEITKDLLIKRGQPLDEYENNMKIQNMARDAAMYMVKNHGWKHIKCCNDSGLLSKDEIFDMVLKTLNLK